MSPGPRTALPDLDAPLGAGSSAASTDAGLGIFAPDTSTAGAAAAAMSAPGFDPTLGGRRRPVGVGAATGAEPTVVPIRAVLGGRTPRSRLALPRLRRQMGVAALTMVTLVAGFGSAWTVRAVFAHVPHTQAPAVWRMQAEGSPVHETRATPGAPAKPSHSPTATHVAAAVPAGGSVDNSARGSLSSGHRTSGHKSSGPQSPRSSGTGHKTTGRTASPSPTEVHHRKGRGTGGGTAAGGAGGADDPATHDATPTIGVDDHGGATGGGGGAGNGGGGGGGGTGLESATPAATPSAIPTPGDPSGSGSGGSSGGGGGGGGGHDDFVAGG